jgi:hypothetical protein
LFGLDGVRLLSKILPRAIFRKIFEAQRSAWLRSQCPRSHNDEGERGKARDEASHRPNIKHQVTSIVVCPLLIQRLFQSVFGNDDRADLDKLSQ